MDYNITRAVVPGLTQTQITQNLIEPGSSYLDRYNQVDVRVGKRFDVGQAVIDANFDIFNLLNTDIVLREIETFGPALGRPLEIPQGRLFRFGANVRF